MHAKDLQRYKRLLLAKRDGLLATRVGAETLVPGAGGWQGDLVDQANSDAEAELQVRVHQSDAHLSRAGSIRASGHRMPTSLAPGSGSVSGKPIFSVPISSDG